MIIFNNLPTELQEKQLLLKPWLKDLVRSHGMLPGDIAYFFCNDEELLIINREFLQHDTYTDIITFDYGTDKVVSVLSVTKALNAASLAVLPKKVIIQSKITINTPASIAL